MSKALIFLCLLMASVCFANAQTKKYSWNDAPKATQSTPGRYTVVLNSQFAKFQILLDTSTGKTWNLKATESGEQVWTEIKRID